MPEFLTITLAVIFCLVILFGCVASVISVFLLFQQSRHLSKVPDSLGEIKGGMREGFDAQVEFLVKLGDAINDLRNALKEGFDAQTEGQKTVAESNIKISNHNSQVLMDTLVTLAQMMELVLKGLGYTPKIGEEPSGLRDLNEAPATNYNRPPVPKPEEGLTFPKI